MFTTPKEVERLTGYVVTIDVISRAQGVIEVHTGRLESEVSGMRDKGLMARAVAYQSAYMRDNAEQIFEQVMVQQAGQNDSLTTYKAADMTAPFIAPLAVMACKKLSWLRSRSVTTGRVDRGLVYNRYRIREWARD